MQKYNVDSGRFKTDTTYQRQSIWFRYLSSLYTNPSLDFLNLYACDLIILLLLILFQKGKEDRSIYHKETFSQSDVGVFQWSGHNA